ncbi:MAG: hypothetical protein Q7V62_03795, partial [Actinomycetota bacterium]|nr:hypothetical protein [Actinomycetota bacterium]
MTTTAAVAAAVATRTLAAGAGTGVAAGFATGTEVAELAGQFGIERIVERHGDTIGGRCGSGSRGGRTLTTGAAVAVAATVAAIAITTVAVATV